MNERYHHGVRVQEKDTELTTPITGVAGLQVVIGTAPVNLTEVPKVNVPVLCHNMQEAREKLGYSEDFKAYTLCQSMYASFVAFAISPVVFINVLDPERHRIENVEKEYDIANGQVKITDTAGIIKSSVVVKAGENTLIENADYLLTFDDNQKMVVTLISETANSAQKLKITSASIAPELVTVADIIGGYDAVTGKESGLEVIRQVYPRTGMAPGFLSAPGWSHVPEIGSVMISKCEAINGVFTAECLLDLDTTKTKLYTHVPQVKEESGYQDRHAIVLWPKVKVNGSQMYYSAIYGAAAAYADAVNDDVPCLSPSNQVVGITSAVLEDETEVFLDREQANVLNGNGIATLINESGWCTWGNNTSAFPEVTDPKDRWICCRRMFTWMSNSLINTYHKRVDNMANFRLIESICDSENIRINSYVAAGKLAGGRIEYNEFENSVENIVSGQIVFRIYMAAFTPAEDILFVLKFDPTLLTDSLKGGEA